MSLSLTVLRRLHPPLSWLYLWYCTSCTCCCDALHAHVAILHRVHLPLSWLTYLCYTSECTCCCSAPHAHVVVQHLMHLLWSGTSHTCHCSAAPHAPAAVVPALLQAPHAPALALAAPHVPATVVGLFAALHARVASCLAPYAPVAVVHHAPHCRSLSGSFCTRRCPSCTVITPDAHAAVMLLVHIMFAVLRIVYLPLS